MLINHFKIAWRNLLKNKVFSFVNIFGLSIGLSTCFLLVLYITDELSYDKHHDGADRLYRVALDTESEKWAGTPGVMASGLKNDFPEIEEVTRVLNFPNTGNLLLRNEERDIQIYEAKGYYADSTFFEIFTYDFKYGTIENALNRPNTVIISEEISNRLFGDENPINKMVNVEIPYGNIDYTVKGVFRKTENKSHVDPNLILSMQNGDIGQWVKGQTNWATNSIFHTYIKLEQGTDPSAFEGKLPAFLERNAGNDFREAGLAKSLFLQPVKDIYLKSSIGHEISSNGSMRYIYIFSSIAAFILLIACVNFMNLSTAKSEKRANEIGVRKAAGASKNSLIFQFLAESMFMCLLSLLLSFIIVLACLPTFNALTQKSLSLMDNPELLFWILGLALVTGLLSGSYPALYLSSFRPVMALKGKGSGTTAATAVRKGLVVFQFCVSACLILVSILFWQQMDFINNRDLGFKKDRQIVVPFRNTSTAQNYSGLKSEVMRIPNVATVSVGSTYPGFELVQSRMFFGEGKTKDEQIEVRLAQIGDDYVETLGYELLHGRTLSDSEIERGDAIVLNETALRQLGYDSSSAVGSPIYYEEAGQRKVYEIVGVVKDFHHESLHKTIAPYGLIGLGQAQPAYFIANVGHGSLDEAISKVENVWNGVNKGTPFEYSFLDEDFQKNYESEKKSSTVTLSFTLIAIFIACIGLYGLASYTTEQRKKEVGIRRVLGASVSSIALLHLGNFMKLVLIALLIASPLSYYLGNSWLQDFTYRINIGWQLFLLGGLFVICIAFVTVGSQVLKAATVNPVKNLKAE
ncbi:ABC transporter permease [Flagellimonas meridianipacifica]|uniref:Putative ABC transport system permease protein n=1 Tax=Flagellimonas meridianipacifica TaxID=1080225 RepID=A0A2T0MD18_9FLAO|nr:ABC transporter permease [Allomuricauda pacifica]PRX55372.1 putative ABC transport system permease protein [Allomuricauda pacifica]